MADEKMHELYCLAPCQGSSEKEIVLTDELILGCKYIPALTSGVQKPVLRKLTEFPGCWMASPSVLTLLEKCQTSVSPQFPPPSAFDPPVLEVSRPESTSCLLLQALLGHVVIPHAAARPLCGEALLAKSLFCKLALLPNGRARTTEFDRMCRLGLSCACAQTADATIMSHNPECEFVAACRCNTWLLGGIRERLITLTALLRDYRALEKALDQADDTNNGPMIEQKLLGMTQEAAYDWEATALRMLARRVFEDTSMSHIR
eukprot:TRINITY_DN7331_c0_g1_i1.p1 TRINITY_DN7331_c0_g1~~TRINITY_DN7331_c0_g1_i1.p1  ORF type:complete len:261 (-),score=26.14 TRINITY_DN7331_c0_g1_i1:173-955(-)